MRFFYMELEHIGLSILNIEPKKKYFFSLVMFFFGGVSDPSMRIDAIRLSTYPSG